METENKLKVKVIPCGQGDCIVLEWIVAENNVQVKKVGIIDCNFDNSAPKQLIKYFSRESIVEIEFLLITHPHTDHYSGIHELIELLCEKELRINRFICSFSNVSKDYVSNIPKLVEYMHQRNGNKVYYQLQLSNMIVKINDHLGREIGIWETFNNTSTIDLNDHFYLKCLSPSQQEVDIFHGMEESRYQIINCDEEGKKFSNNPMGNFLSIALGLIRVKDKKCIALFNSDMMLSSFERFNNSNYSSYLPSLEKLLLIQIPHHGSSKNHHQEFWDSIDLRNVHSFISVGRNHYGHPNSDIVKYFTKKCKKFSTTNIGINSYEDDIYTILGKEFSSNLNNSLGEQIEYILDTEGNCTLL